MTSRKKNKTAGTLNETIKGTTYIFLTTSNSSNLSFQKRMISSERIAITKYPDLAAIQTQQFQKTAANLKGHACMVYRDGIWKLFFVYDSSTIYHGYISVYKYKHYIDNKNDLISITISGNDKEFYWVNLREENFPKNSLRNLQFPVVVSNGCYYGNHTPSKIQLPKFDMNVRQQLEIQTNISELPKTQSTSMGKNKEEENLTHEVAINNSWNVAGKPQSVIRKRKRGGKERGIIPIFRTKHTDGINFLTIFQPDNYEVPYKKFLESSMLYVAVPYKLAGKNIDNHPFQIVQYALVHYSHIHELQESQEDEYNKKLKRICRLNFYLFQPTIHQPIRFCIVNKKQYDDMIIQKKLYSWENLTTANE